MPKLPPITGRQALDVLYDAGFEFFHQVGSHVTVKHPITKRKVTVPVHGNKELRPGTLSAVIRDSGLGRQGFLELLR